MTRFFSYRYGLITGKACAKLARDNRLVGAETYFGKMCKQCDNNLRNTADRSCVICSALRFKRNDIEDAKRAVKASLEFPVDTMHTDRAIRRAAAAAGMNTYYGCKCECGNDKRYTQRGQCVKCVKARNDKRPTAKPRKKKPAVAALAGSEFDHLFE